MKKSNILLKLREFSEIRHCCIKQLCYDRANCYMPQHCILTQAIVAQMLCTQRPIELCLPKSLLQDRGLWLAVIKAVKDKMCSGQLSYHQLGCCCTTLKTLVAALLMSNKA